MNIFTYFSNAFRTLTAKGRRNGLKILTLGVGLALGLVLISKVCFERTYDDFYKNSDRIHYLNERIMMEGELALYNQASGGTARRLKELYPEVEEATRFTFFESEASLKIKGTDRRVEAPLVQFADASFFNILDRKCLAGRLGSELDVPCNAVISSKMAEKIAGKGKSAASDAIGTQFTLGSQGDDVVMTIVGVYEEFPLNASNRPDVLVAMPTIGRFMYDGSDQTMGNDRYTTLFRLAKGTDLKDFNANLDRYVKKYLPYEEFDDWGVEFEYVASPYEEYHNNDSDSKNRTLVLALVALALLLTSVLNYILIVVSTSVTRSKEMALRKCLGSGNADIYMMIFAEAFLHTLLATVFGAVLLLALRNPASELIGTDIVEMFSGKPLLLAVATLVLVVLVNGIVPAAMFNRIPVASAFRNYKANKRTWKLGLLSVEFSAVSFLGVLICVISLQYSKMMDQDLGFDYDKVLEVAIPESTPEQAGRIKDAVKKLSYVEDAAFGFQSLFQRLGGNNVNIPGETTMLMNIRDGYYTDEDYLSTMGIKLVEGRGFTPGMRNDEEVIVDRRFVKTMKETSGWDSVIGRSVVISGHDKGNGTPLTIVGVIDDVNTGSFSSENRAWDSRPLAFFYLNNNALTDGSHFPYIYIRIDGMSPEKVAEVTNLINSIVPDQQIYPDSLMNKHNYSHVETRDTRNAILLGSIVALLIAILGLAGYTIDEIRRRSKEIAVRRVNGAQFIEIRRMFMVDILKVAAPAVLLGCVLAAFLARSWEQQFTIQAGLPVWVFLTVASGTMVIISAISDYYVRKVANCNPSENIKSE